MSLTLALNNALSGINVSQNSLAVLSNNVANANTTGYSRQVAEQLPNVVGTQGAGARIEQIVRKIDVYLNRAVRDQNSEVGRASVLSDYMSRIQVMMGEPGAGNSLDVRIENFFNVLQALSDAPELVSTRAQVVNAGEILAREMSDLALGMEELRFQAEEEIQDSVRIVNDELMRLYELNQAIHRAASLGEPTANFLDRRDVAINRIAEQIDIKTLEIESGQVNLYTTSGIALLEHIPYQLQYRGIDYKETLINDGVLPAITVDGVRDDGTLLNRPVELVSAGVDNDIETSLVSGKLKGLLELRNNEIPDMLEQLDNIAATLRDEFNAIHNSGSGSPAISTMTGARAVGLNDPLEWTGTARIAVLNEDGSPVQSRYASTDTGFLALDLDFDSLRSELGDQLTTQTIINEINAHFQPQNKAVVGNMNNITISSLSGTIPDGSGNFAFDLELENISDSDSNLWVNNITVLDDGGVDISAVTSTAPAPFNFDSPGTFDTTLGSSVVTVNAAGHGLSSGDVIYLDNIGGPIGGIPAADFNGQAFEVTVLDNNRFSIQVTSGNVAAGPGPTDDPAATGQLAYAQQEEGQKSRTSGNGDFTLDLTGNPASSYYTVQLDVMVEDDNGNLVNSTIAYRINNNQAGSMNRRFAANQIVAGAGTVEVPTVGQPLMRAEFVDENGLPTSSTEDGYLRLRASNVPGLADEFYTIAIDDLSSSELGLPNENPPQQGSGRGFSHYFELNNFFVSNNPTATGDTVTGSAINMAMRQDLLDNANLLSMGTLTQTPDPADGSFPDYSYERTVGDSSVSQRLAALGLTAISFDAAGGLAASSKSFNGYASEILGYAGGRANAADVRLEDEQTLMDGYKARAESISGVNIDEEMANTIIFQNAYSASSQVIRTVRDLFDTLLASF